MPKRKSKKRPAGDWVGTAIAAAALGVSVDWLYLQLEHLKHGFYWRDVRSPHSSRACYRWHLKRLEQWIANRPNQR